MCRDERNENLSKSEGMELELQSAEYNQWSVMR